MVPKGLDLSISENKGASSEMYKDVGENRGVQLGTVLTVRSLLPSKKEVESWLDIQIQREGARPGPMMEI